MVTWKSEPPEGNCLESYMCMGHGMEADLYVDYVVDIGWTYSTYLDLDGADKRLVPIPNVTTAEEAQAVALMLARME